MRIQLDESHVLCTDKYCCWVMEQIVGVKGKSKGEIYERRCSGYYQKFEDLIEDYVGEKFQSNEATELKELAQELKQLKKLARTWCKANNG